MLRAPMSEPLPYPYQTLPQVVTWAAREFGDALALADGDARLSFRELLAATDRAARAFMAAGIRAGDRVAVWAPNVGEWVIAATGLQAAGGVLVPLNTRFKGSEAGYVLRKSRARALCTVNGFLGNDYVELLRATFGGAGAPRPVADLPDLERIVVLRGTAPAGTQTWSEFLAAAERTPQAALEARRDAVARDDLCDMLFTSGTTGNPKGVMTSHEQALRATHGWIECVTLRAGDRYLIVNPFFHAFGYRSGWLACLMTGAAIFPQLVFDVPEVLRRVAAERISVLPGPPTIYQSILAHPDRHRYDLSSLRVGVTGAAAIPTELVRRVLDELDFEVLVTGYALTESSAAASMCRPDDDPETIATTSGRAVPGVEIRIVDADNRPLPPGTAGEIAIRGYNVMKGYFDDPEETAKAIDSGGWLHTGDVGVLDERGYLRITDRLKDMVIVGGFNAYPAEIENILVGMKQIQHVGVVGVPDERLGEVSMAFIVCKPGETLTAQQVIDWSRANMANYKVPRYVAFLDELPLTPSGKVQKFRLRELARQLHPEVFRPG
jgi:acyl-CoA synthetase (AMP-forming)/AMP-acid ligase II